MPNSLQRRFAALVRAGGPEILCGGYKGIEKESLRVDGEGYIAQTPHPRALGSALTHPYITTDYSEALIELITPPLGEVGETMEFLADLHAFVYDKLGDELLWATSMPCAVESDACIPIAEYGRSNVGMMKHIYRRGLEYRYGRRMQAISGVHFNFSLPEGFWPVFVEEEEMAGSLQDCISEGYFALIRNFHRHGWLIPLLFGTSPAVCKSFLPGSSSRFQELDPHTLYLPYATSLRMSDIGYKNKNQAALEVSYDSVDDYVACLSHAIETPYPEYEAIGVKVGDQYRQLNANLLQIENEYYSFIRPKRTTRTGERPTLALSRRGVEYVEVRALDVSAFDPLGVNLEQLRFIEAFLIYCLMDDSPGISAGEREAISYNELTVALRGREPGLRLRVREGWRPLAGWAEAIFEDLAPICAVLDNCHPEKPYSAALEAQRRALREPDTLPSARVLQAMREAGLPFAKFAARMSEEHAAYFARRGLSPARRAELERLAAESLAEQARMEQSEVEPFEEYLARYFAAADA